MKTRTRKPRLFVVRNRLGFFWQGRDYWTFRPRDAQQFLGLATAQDAARTLGGVVVSIRPRRLKGGVS